jgi:hypothetical protein
LTSSARATGRHPSAIQRGIAAGSCPHFRIFVQVDTSLERSVAAGLGLTLVKPGGDARTVAVHSAGVGQGNEFVVRLPVLKR